jgi:small-conductance mechanosensitive channel
MKSISWFKVFLPITRHSLYIYPKILLLIAFIVFNSLIPDSFYEVFLLRMIILGIPSYLFINIVFSYIRSVGVKLYLRKHNYEIGHKDKYILGVQRLSLFASNALFLVVFFALAGLSITNILTSLGLFAVALTLITKDYINNFINGILIMFSKNIKLNEYVKVGDVKGRITDITFSNTEIQTESGEVYYFPNTIIYTKEIANLSRNKTRTIKVESTIPTPNVKEYNSLKNSISTSLKSLKLDSVSISLNKVNKDTADILVSITTKKYSYEIEKNAKENTLLELLKYSEKKQVKKKKE